MDWPVIGAVTAVAVIGGAVVFEGVALLRSDTPAIKPQRMLTSYGSSVDRTAYDIPGFGGSGSGERPLSFPLIRLIDPDRDLAIEQAKPSANVPEIKGAAPAQGKKTPLSQDLVKVDSSKADTAKAPPVSSEAKVAKLMPTDQGATPSPGAAIGAVPAVTRPEQWRVVATVNASYFNLGGHIDKAGVVDSLASSHLRDALKQHSKFGQLPPDIRTHILTQNIDLCRVAPYRTLLGMDDRVLEQEQAVKFIRVR
jgi:hypothetical protein